MKKFIIMSMTIDGPTADDDGVFCAGNFGLVGTLALNTRQEAEEVLEQTRDTDMADFEDLYEINPDDEAESESGYTVFKEDGCNGEKELNVYYLGDIVNSTRYKIEEVEF